MKKNVSQPINQRRLRELTNLSPSVIRHLKETNILQYRRVGTEDIFDEQSVNRFMESFRISDYLTIGECRKKLDRWKFYTVRPEWRKIYVNPLGFYVTVIQLIRGGYGIPSEYLLTTTDFGKTKYISRTQFAHTLNWLRKVNHRVNPKQPPFVPTTPIVKKPKQNGLGGLKRIGQKKQQTPHPMVIPFMECPLSPLTH
ncbi:hypothetical protein [Aeromonas veronii]|uniref:hypothetical protein n=1 Tax=Aeromonas veronii TaxID=654 RepID=UPI003D25B5E0